MISKKMISYIFSGLFVLSGIFCIISLTYTSVEKMSGISLNQKLARSQKALEEASKKEASFSEWRNIKDHLQHFRDEFLMDIDEFSKFRDDILVLFNKYHLANKIPKYKYKRLFKNYLQVSISFSLSGSYPNLKRFIHEVSNLKKMILIKSIKFNKNIERGDITAGFSMEVYLVH